MLSAVVLLLSFLLLLFSVPVGLLLLGGPLVGRHTLPALLPPQTSRAAGVGPARAFKDKKAEGSELHKPGFGKLLTLVLFLRM